MSSKKGSGSLASISDIGVPQRTLVSPVSDLIDIVPIQMSRKRKHVEIDDRNRLGEPFSIQVFKCSVFINGIPTDMRFEGTPFASISQSPALDAQASTSSVISTTSLS